jgi:ketosteroid isomerase-like protein
MKSMKTHLPTSIFAALFLAAIAACESPDHRRSAAAEIEAAELAFAKMAKEQGVPAAFLAYAADSAVLMRNDALIEGKDAMQAYFAKSTLDSVQLAWAPDKVVASRSGDLGYTYGKYQFSAKGSTGQVIRAEGIFHTVWQKQADGTWKFVWD